MHLPYSPTYGPSGAEVYITVPSDSAEEQWSALRHRAHTITEAARLLQIHPDTVRRLIRLGELPAKRVGIQWRIPGDWLVDTLRQSK